MSRRTAGFTLVEIMVALVILAVGVLALAGGSLIVSRDLSASRSSTVAANLAQARLDHLRLLAASTTPQCSSRELASSSSPVVSGAVAVSWIVEGAGPERTIRVLTAYSGPSGRERADTIVTVVPC
jgi:prepilin-type N-terminal cleavage/methylation domain-containing protein